MDYLHLDGAAQEIRTSTHDLLRELYALEERVSCSCHHLTLSMYEQKVKELLAVYLSLLQNYVSKDVILDESVFCQDYYAIKTDLLRHNITLAEAQRSLSLWHGAVAHERLQSFLLDLMYRYITSSYPLS